MLQFTDAHIEQLLNGINQFYWAFIRIGGVLLVAPVIGDAAVPMRVKMGMCVVLTLVIAPALAPIVRIEPFSAMGILMIGMQLLIGIAMGFIVKIVFAAVTVAGESIATSMGLGYAMINDPSNGRQVPIVSQFYTIIVTFLFLAYGGHHVVIQLLSISFLYLPVGESVSGNMLWLIIEWSAVIFSGAVKMALPAIAALLSVNLIMGIMTRTSPQLNLFSIGFPITTTIGFVVMLLSLPIVAQSFYSLLLDTFDTIDLWLQTR